MSTDLQGMEFFNFDSYENDEGHVDNMCPFTEEPAVPSPVSTASENSQQLDEAPSMAKWTWNNQAALTGFMSDEKVDFTSTFDFGTDVSAPGANETLSLGAFDYEAIFSSQSVVDANQAILPFSDATYGSLAYANNMVGVWASQANTFPPGTPESADISPALSPALSSTLVVPATASPAELVIQTPRSTKRKLSSDSEGTEASAPGPAKRGRKSSSNAASRPAVVPEGSPLARSVTMAAEVSLPSASSSPHNGSPIALVDPARKRPKSVVPEKWFKNNYAQSILGMTEQQIKSYASYDDILEQLEGTDRYEKAVEFGDVLESNRGQARGAAKKSRDEKRMQKEALIKLQTELEDERAATKARNDHVAAQLAKLVAAGLLTPAQAAAVIS